MNNLVTKIVVTNNEIRDFHNLNDKEKVKSFRKIERNRDIITEKLKNLIKKEEERIKK